MTQATAPAIAVGLDLGGTKIEAQVFDADWAVADRRRVETPKDYDALVAAMAALIGWATAGHRVPVGVAAAGLVHPRSGLAYTANLPATGRPFPADIAAAAGLPVAYVNDCRALTLSEATFGAGRGLSPVAGLILGTGVGAGVAVGGHLLEGLSRVGGEFGHTPAAAHIVVARGLPVVRCGCGRMGCIETYIAGPGMTRLATHITGQPLTPREVAERRATDRQAQQVWDLWADLVAELLITVTMMIDPEVILLGGGLSTMPGVTGSLTAALQRAQLPGFDVPAIRLAEGGETSGARGAAYAAWQAAGQAAGR